MRWFVFFLSVLAAPAAAEELLTVHSDLPFLPKPGQSVSPFPCSGPGFAATCYDFPVGNWKETDLRCAAAAPHAAVCETWFSVWNTSPIHPAFRFRETASKDQAADYEPARLIRLTPKTENKALYALEIGFETGSRYLLLSMDATKPRHAGILDLRCEGDGATWRSMAEPISIFRTDYCSVASIDALERMAREALKRPPYATLDWVDDTMPPK
jgi:hypothetical protein